MIHSFTKNRTIENHSYCNIQIFLDELCNDVIITIANTNDQVLSANRFYNDFMLNDDNCKNGLAMFRQ